MGLQMPTGGPATGGTLGSRGLYYAGKFGQGAGLAMASSPCKELETIEL